MEHNAFSKQLFAGIAPGYDRWAEVFSLFQYRRWHAALIAALDPQHGEHVLDVSTGTGAVAFDLADRGCAVVGLDLSREMLSQAVSRKATPTARMPAPSRPLQFVEGRGEDLPFADATFDAATFTFLLRYVADPARPIKEIARVLRGGGRVAMLEFAVPESPITQRLWSLYAFAILPLLTRPVSHGWADVGAFLGHSISDFYRRYPLSNLVSDWEGAGFRDIRCRRLSLGGAVIVSGEKP